MYNSKTESTEKLKDDEQQLHIQCKGADQDQPKQTDYNLPNLTSSGAYITLFPLSSAKTRATASRRKSKLRMATKTQCTNHTCRKRDARIIISETLHNRLIFRVAESRQEAVKVSPNYPQKNFQNKTQTDFCLQRIQHLIYVKYSHQMNVKIHIFKDDK